MQAEQQLTTKLAALLQTDLRSDLFALLADYQRILADNTQRSERNL